MRTAPAGTPVPRQSDPDVLVCALRPMATDPAQGSLNPRTQLVLAGTGKSG